MRRRTVLGGASALAAGASGCLDGLPGDGTAEFTVSDPLDSIHERGSCTTGRVIASVSFDGPLDEPGDESAVVRYPALDESSQSLVRFALARESAVACEDENPEPFRSLLGEFGALSDRYREEQGANPRHHAVQTDDEYHRLDSLRFRDQVLDG